MITLKDINENFVKDLQTNNHPSEFISKDGLSLLILRLPEIKDKKISILSYAFVIKENSAYIYEREKETFNHFGSINDINSFLEEKTHKLITQIQHYHFEIEQLEESLYDDNVSKMFMQKWLSYKKDVSLINRLAFHSIFAYELFLKHFKEKINENELNFTDVLEHFNRLKDLSFAAMEKLDNLYDFYRAKVDEKMNKNMYYLTIISGIFLPLTLITGFFGMNSGGLPFVNDSQGTLKVVIISIILELMFIIPFIMLNIQKIKKYKG